MDYRFHTIEEVRLLREKVIMLEDALQQRRVQFERAACVARLDYEAGLRRIYLPNHLFNEIAAALMSTASAKQRQSAYDALIEWRSRDRAP